jgi:hypothetical protein
MSSISRSGSQAGSAIAGAEIAIMVAMNVDLIIANLLAKLSST